MYYLTDFKYFVSIYSLIFDQIDPLFIDFNCVWPLIFTKTSIRLVPNVFFVCFFLFFYILTPATKNLMKYPPPGVDYTNTWLQFSDTHLLMSVWRKIVTNWYFWLCLTFCTSKDRQIVNRWGGGGDRIKKFAIKI